MNLEYKMPLIKNAGIIDGNGDKPQNNPPALVN